MKTNVNYCQTQDFQSEYLNLKEDFTENFNKKPNQGVPNYLKMEDLGDILL